MPAKKIILSDDRVLTFILENSFFKRDGFDLVTVKDSRTALEAVEEEAPTLAIFDLAVSAEQILANCHTIKNDPLLAATPVLLLLPENADGEMADLCWDAGCDAVVHRPLSAERFLDAACSLLGISRRLARRFPVNFRLELLDSKQKKHVGSCVNLNSGGMYLETEKLFPVGTRLEAEFVLPEFETPFRCSVKVAWVNHPEWRKKNALPCGLGVQFLDPSQTVKSALREFINNQELEG